MLLRLLQIRAQTHLIALFANNYQHLRTENSNPHSFISYINTINRPLCQTNSSSKRYPLHALRYTKCDIRTTIYESDFAGGRSRPKVKAAVLRRCSHRERNKALTEKAFSPENALRSHPNLCDLACIPMSFIGAVPSVAEKNP